jgi:hypothetical protein
MEPKELAEQAMLEEMRRQTRALENINTYLMRFFAVLAVFLVLWLISLFA